jgi:GTP cyclohydrolase I
MVDKSAVERAIQEIIKAIPDDISREGLVDTPKRVAEMYQEIFSGMCQDPREELSVGYELGHHEMVILKDIAFYSMCEHHLLPFFGNVHIGYVPNEEGRIVGISKLARVVECISRRPQIQERMVTEIADAINDALKPNGVAVVIEAEHLCMVMRGIKKPGSTVITSALRGLFRRNAASRAEFLSLINGH